MKEHGNPSNVYNSTHVQKPFVSAPRHTKCPFLRYINHPCSLTEHWTGPGVCGLPLELGSCDRFQRLVNWLTKLKSNP